MMRSLFSAISGLKGHQTMMDVVGNNIANVNTTAYKSGRMTFQDIINQTLRGAQAPAGAMGGLNPIQVGLGVQTGTIDTVVTQGNLQSTGKATDVAVQGDGYLMLDDGAGGTVYTRDGNLNFDSGGFLVHSASGMRVQGIAGAIPANATGINIAPNGTLTYTLPDGTTGNGGTIQLAKFANPEGLTRSGGNLFRVSANSGAAVVGAAGAAGMGTIQAGFLEMSNVDLAAQFTNMIIAQRGFQANSRVITASDEILQDLVNIKR